MLNKMYLHKERVIDALMTQAKEVATHMEREEASQFYSELADRAYAQHEESSIDNECEMQDYENDNQ